jgi:hypothetical protein
VKGVLHTEDENKYNHLRKVLNLMKGRDKYSDSSIELAAHSQNFKQQKQLNSRSHDIPLSINTEWL